jgi:hypothetical protein
MAAGTGEASTPGPTEVGECGVGVVVGVGCARACECVKAGWWLTGVCGCLGGGLLGFHVGRYEGDFRDGKIHGQGIKTWPDGAR